jgi:hypothetical protein
LYQLALSQLLVGIKDETNKLKLITFGYKMIDACEAKILPVANYRLVFFS